MDIMRLSAPDWCFFKEAMPPDVYYGRLREIGYSAVEMVAPERWAAARAAGLDILNLSGPGMQTGLNRLENHGRLASEIRDAIILAAENGIGHVIVFSGNRSGQSDAEGLANCRKAFESLLPEAERRGVVLAFEMLNGFDHQDYQADRSAFGFTLARHFASPHFKVIYDIYHMHRMGEDVAADIKANVVHIAHLHVAGAPRRNFPGESQEIDYAAVVAAARGTGYRGYWGMEFLPGPDALGDLERAAKHWGDLFGTTD